MYVFLNRKKSGLFADELFQLIQANFPEVLKIEPYKSIRTFFNSVVLNDTQVYSQEYTGTPVKLTPEYNLFQINYSVEVVFTKGCFNKCPED
jgi:hypothetical protein